VIARYNFKLEIGSAASTVDVTAVAANIITESSSTIGQVLDQRSVADLPLVSNNVLDLMKTMAGVRGQGLGENATFAGVTTGMVNTSRDGLSVQEGRYAAGVGSTTLINPEMVGELRVILAPVDAELGRGNGQVQILTRSGTNKLHGSAVWSVRNSALEYLDQQSCCREWRVEAHSAHVDQPASGNSERRRSDHSEQDLLFYVV